MSRPCDTGAATCGISRGTRPRPTASALALLLAIALAEAAEAQAVVPTDFVDELVVGGLDLPTAMAFLPDGRLLLVEVTTARVRLIVNQALSAVDPVVTVDSVRTGSEQGLLGIAVDPGWPTRPYFYVQYNYSGGPFIRISRFTAAGDLDFSGNGSLIVDPATRYDVFSDLEDLRSFHNGGTLRFGPDGMLYSSLGDDGSSCAAQDLTRLVGKILRLDVSNLPAGPGGPPPPGLLTPPDNPFIGHSNAQARLVWAYGLRNPFSFSLDPMTGDAFIADVGGDTWEEIDWAPTPGMNFSWPLYEGPQRMPVTCAGVDSSGFTQPIYAYAQAENPEQAASVISAGIYRRPSLVSGVFPPEYEGDYFLHDFYRAFLRRLKRTGGTWSIAPAVPGQPSATDWARLSPWNSNFLVGPKDGALWYCRFWVTFPDPNTGQIRRIRYTGTVSAPDPAAHGVEFRAPFPSPSRGPVSIDYTLAVESPVEIAVYDLAGRRSRLLIGREREGPGPHHAVWDGRDHAGHAVGPGIYLVRLMIAGQRFVRRLVVVR